ncbi:MAG TPA: NADH-quinone oxidoreductase subunit N, partial [Thermoanaerobaculia bacterium]|nr:NADH-quinone oxidoreductase subunit N [Thermoanaerobaculia bacterium]
PMNTANMVDLSSIAPEILLCAVGVLVLLLEAFAPSLRRVFTALSAAAVAAAAWLAFGVAEGPSFGGLIEWSSTTEAFALVVLLSTFLGLAASDGYLRREGILAGEYHALILWCAAGLLFMLRATELLTVFVALETLSLALYALAAFNRKVKVGSEAAVKYFLLGAFASAFVLYGLALLYGETGSTRLDAIGAALTGDGSTLASLGVLLLIAGFGFKMSLVPFHAWSPDTYQGAPSPFVGFLSVAPKVASALVLIRILEMVAGNVAFDSARIVSILAVASMLVGNLFALVQRDLKRMLAYSGIAHMGYLLIALVTLTPESSKAVLVYLLAYALMNAGAFAVIAVLYARAGEPHLISELSGWGYRFPALGAALTVCMLSLGGIPPTLGFIGKYVVFVHAVRQGDLWIAVVGVLASLVGVFYYLRVVYTLYMRPEERVPVAGVGRDAWGGAAAALAALALLVLGILPGPILDWVWQAGSGAF